MRGPKHLETQAANCLCSLIKEAQRKPIASQKVIAIGGYEWQQGSGEQRGCAGDILWLTLVA